MGNMLTLYPQLFGAIVCEVPLLDMKRYSHLVGRRLVDGRVRQSRYPPTGTSSRLSRRTRTWRRAATYPPVLFYTTTSDDRVGPAQARKMAAKMQARILPNVWFYENIEGGHGAGADNKQAAHMHALAYTFLWDQLK